LEKIEREKPEELEDSKLEIVRRKTVVKVWKLQVKVMERERQLEQMMRYVQEEISIWRKIDRERETWDRNILKLDKGTLDAENVLWQFEKKAGLDFVKHWSSGRGHLKYLKKRLCSLCWFEMACYLALTTMRLVCEVIFSLERPGLPGGEHPPPHLTAHLSPEVGPGQAVATRWSKNQLNQEQIPVIQILDSSDDEME